MKYLSLKNFVFSLFCVLLIFTSPILGESAVFKIQECSFEIELPPNWINVKQFQKDSENLLFFAKSNTGESNIKIEIVKNALETKTFDTLDESQLEKIKDEFAVKLQDAYKNISLGDAYYAPNQSGNTLILLTYAFLKPEDKTFTSAALAIGCVNNNLYFLRIETKDTSKIHFNEFLEMLDNFSIL